MRDLNPAELAFVYGAGNSPTPPAGPRPRPCKKGSGSKGSKSKGSKSKGSKSKGSKGKKGKKGKRC